MTGRESPSPGTVWEKATHFAGIAGVVLAAAFFLVWQAMHRGLAQYVTAIYPFDDADEWRYTACSRLVEHGYALFSQVFSAQPPLLFLSLAAGMRLGGDSIQGARLTEMGFGLLALVAAAWLAWQLSGPLAGGIAALLLAVSPAFLVYGRAVEAEGPMMALVTLSLAVALRARCSRSNSLSLLAGLILAGAILVKLFAIEAIVPALWLLVCPLSGINRQVPATEPAGTRFGRPAQRQMAPAGLFLLGAGLPVVADLIFISPAAQWSQVVTLHDRVAGMALPGQASAVTVLLHFLALDLGLTVLAAAGIITLLLIRAWYQGLFLLLWAGGTALMLVLFRPLFPHHPAILLTALGVSAGCGIAELFGSLPRPRTFLLPMAAAVLLYLALTPRLVHDDRHVLIPGYRPDVLALAPYVAAHDMPAQMIAVDDLAIADLAHRLVAPPLCDPSNVRLHAGYLTANDLINATRQYRVHLVLPSSSIYAQVPGYMRWLQVHYRAARAPAGKTAFFGPKNILLR
ncbi:MAG: glycosyltransferase family 39 protein [Chloroflexota bacterium]|nr:glycosyltransferase family 39 protein [Chloroflexota bacterium]